METEASGDDDAAAKKGDAKKEKPKEAEKPKEEEKKEEPVSTPLVARPAQNWSDFFFIIDCLSYNIDTCDLILFMTKINPVPGLENKKVSVDISYLDTTSTTMVVSHTDAGVIESLLGMNYFLLLIDFLQLHQQTWKSKNRPVDIYIITKYLVN